jgi:nitrogenase subunit NifH
MKILICGKGGSGKSTLATLISIAMHKIGKRFLWMRMNQISAYIVCETKVRHEIIKL